MYYDNIKVYDLQYEGLYQKTNKVKIFDWSCNAYEGNENNMKPSDLAMSTYVEKMEVVIPGTISFIKTWMFCTIVNPLWKDCWEFEVIKVKVNQSVSWRVNNTKLLIYSVWTDAE